MDSSERGEVASHLEAPGEIQLRAKHDAVLIRQALEKEQANLEKIGKKLGDENYPRESRVILADAAAIKEYILPAVRVQAELDLISGSDVEEALAGAFQRTVYKAFEGLADPKVLVTPEALAHRRAKLIEGLASMVRAFAIDLSSSSFDQGLAARLTTPERMTHRALDTLRAAALV